MEGEKTPVLTLPPLYFVVLVIALRLTYDTYGRCHIGRLVSVTSYIDDPVEDYLGEISIYPRGRSLILTMYRKCFGNIVG